MGVHLLVLPFKMGIYRKRNVHGIGSSLAPAGVFLCKYGRLYPAACSRRGISAQKWISIPRHACPLPKLPHSLANPPHFLNSILIHAISNRRRRLTAVLSQHRMYRSVYGAFNS